MSKKPDNGANGATDNSKPADGATATQPTTKDIASFIAQQAREALAGGLGAVASANAVATACGRRSALTDPDKRKLSIPLPDGRTLVTKGHSPVDGDATLDNMVEASFSAKTAQFQSAVETAVIGQDGKAKKATETVPVTVFDGAVAAAVGSENATYNRAETIVASILIKNEKLAKAIMARMKK